MSKQGCKKFRCSGDLNKVRDLNRGEVMVCSECGTRYNLEGELI